MPIFKTYDFDHGERHWEEVRPDDWDHLPDHRREILYLQDQHRIAFVALVTVARKGGD